MTRYRLPPVPLILGREAGDADLSLFASYPVPVIWRWQRWYDPTRHLWRDARWYGRCVGCGRNVWAFDDGENDPRGVLGDNALWVIGEEGDPRRCCALCANDEDGVSYRRVMAARSDYRPNVWPDERNGHY